MLDLPTPHKAVDIDVYPQIACDDCIVVVVGRATYITSQLIVSNL